MSDKIQITVAGGTSEERLLLTALLNFSLENALSDRPGDRCEKSTHSRKHVHCPVFAEQPDLLESLDFNLERRIRMRVRSAVELLVDKAGVKLPGKPAAKSRKRSSRAS